MCCLRVGRPVLVAVVYGRVREVHRHQAGLRSGVVVSAASRQYALAPIGGERPACCDLPRASSEAFRDTHGVGSDQVHARLGRVCQVPRIIPDQPRRDSSAGGQG